MAICTLDVVVNAEKYTLFVCQFDKGVFSKSYDTAHDNFGHLRNRDSVCVR